MHPLTTHQIVDLATADLRRAERRRRGLLAPRPRPLLVRASGARIGSRSFAHAPIS